MRDEVGNVHVRPLKVVMHDVSLRREPFEILDAGPRNACRCKIEILLRAMDQVIDNGFITG